MMPWNYYYAEFYASNDWEIIDIPLSSFKYSRNQNDNLNSKVIRSIGIVAYGKDFSAQLDLANIELYYSAFFRPRKNLYENCDAISARIL